MSTPFLQRPDDKTRSDHHHDAVIFPAGDFLSYRYVRALNIPGQDRLENLIFIDAAKLDRVHRG